MENLTAIEHAWIYYLLGAAGCTLATYFLFRRLGAAVTHFFVITVAVILFTPYAIEEGSTSMGPAMYRLVLGYLDFGFDAVRPVVKLMLIIWAVALVLSLIYQLLMWKIKKPVSALDADSEQTEIMESESAESSDDAITMRDYEQK
jgi:hypothetical protein